MKANPSMERGTIFGAAAALILVLVVAAPALTHTNPPVVLVSDRDAVVTLLAGSRRVFVREVRLSPEQREAIGRERGWVPDQELYRFYVGRDGEGRALAAVIFLTEFTAHGATRVAVALDPDGKVKDAMIVELTEEAYPSVKPLIDHQFTREYIGQGANGRFALTERAEALGGSMTQFYGRVVARLIQRAAILYEVGVITGRSSRSAIGG